MDGITAGTVVGGKVLTVDNNKDLSGIRNLTATDSIVIGTTSISGTTVAPIGGITLGQSSNGKVITQDNSGRIAIGAAGGNQVLNIVSHDNVDGGLELAGLVTSSAAELNILDGVTANKDDLNKLDGSSAGAISNSKAVIYGANGEVNASKLQIGSTDVTSTATELNILSGANVTASELNVLSGVTADSDDINKLTGVSPGVVSNNKAAIYGDAGQLNATSIQIEGSTVINCSRT